MSIPATTAELEKLVLPFVGAKLGKGANAGILIDIAHGACRSRDADIREVSAEGITRFFYSGCEFIPWAKVREIVTYRWDESGRNRVCEQVFAHVPEVQARAA